jgi:hypothetical protein
MRDVGPEVESSRRDCKAGGDSFNGFVFRVASHSLRLVGTISRNAGGIHDPLLDADYAFGPCGRSSDGMHKATDKSNTSE